MNTNEKRDDLIGYPFFVKILFQKLSASVHHSSEHGEGIEATGISVIIDVKLDLITAADGVADDLDVCPGDQSDLDRYFLHFSVCFLQVDGVFSVFDDDGGLRNVFGIFDP